MYLVLMKLVLAALLATALAACGREDANPTTPAGSGKGAAKSDAGKAGTPEDAAKPADPLKDGY